MNADVFRLIRIYLIEVFSLNAFRSKDSKTVWKAVGLMVAYLMVGAVMAFYIAAITFALSMFGAGEYVFPLCGLISAVLTFMTVLFKSHSFLYGAKDTEMLSAMPLRSRDFITARLSVLYLFELPFNLVIFLPALIVYAVTVQPSAGFYLSFLIGFLFLPVLPFFIGVAGGVLVSYVASRFRFTKLIGAFLSMALLVGLMCVLYNPANYQAIDNFYALDEVETATFFQQTFEPLIQGNFVTRGYAAVFAGNVSANVIFVLLSVAVSALIIWMLCRNYLRFVDAVNAPMKRKTFRKEEISSSSSPVFALYHRELKRYFSSVTYVINTLIGGVLLLVAAIALFAAGDEFFREFTAEAGMEEFSLHLAAVVPIVMCLFVGMAPTTTVSLSMEGKTFWLLQTLPVKPATVYFSKALVCLTTTVPAVLVAATLMILKFRPGVLLAVLFYLLPLIFSVFSAYWGLWLNSKFMRLDWTNETNVVKQSPPAMIAVFSTMFPIMFGAGVFLFLPETLSVMVYTALCGLFAGLTVLLVYTVNKKPLQKLVAA